MDLYKMIVIAKVYWKPTDCRFIDNLLKTYSLDYMDTWENYLI